MFLAYALVLHGVFAGTASASRGVPAVAAAYLCRTMVGVGGTTPGAPDQSRHDHAACALCGTGHCGMALPAEGQRPRPPSFAAVADIGAVDPGVAPPSRRGVAARPRGPPAPA